MRAVSFVFFFAILWTGVASAQGDAQKNCNTGQNFKVSAGQTGGANVEGECPESESLAKICDVLNFDAIGGVARECTIHVDSCVPLGGSPPSCGSADLRSARDAISAGQYVSLNQYTPDSTQRTASFASTPVSTSEMDAIMGAFAVDMEGPITTPADSQSMRESFGVFLAEQHQENFMSGPPPPVSYSTWPSIVPQTDVAPQNGTQLSFNSFANLRPPISDLSGEIPRIDYSFWEYHPGSFSYTGSVDPYAGGSFRWEGTSPSVAAFVPDAGPFDFGQNPSYIPYYFSSDYAPQLDRLDPAEAPISPFAWYSAGVAMPPGYNPFEAYQGREMWWSDNLPQGFGEEMTKSGSSFELPSDPTWYERAWNTTRDFAVTEWNNPCWRSLSCTQDAVSNAAANTWDFMRNFNCRVRKAGEQPLPGDSC